MGKGAARSAAGELRRAVGGHRVLCQGVGARPHEHGICGVERSGEGGEAEARRTRGTGRIIFILVFFSEKYSRLDSAEIILCFGPLLGVIGRGPKVTLLSVIYFDIEQRCRRFDLRGSLDR